MFSDERLRSMLASVAEEPTPRAEFLDDLWSLLARERRRTLSGPRRFPLPIAAALAALLLALTVGLLLVIGAWPKSPPILRGLAGTVEVDGSTNLLLAHQGTVIVGKPGMMSRIDTEKMSLPGAVGPFRAVAVGPAGWWVADTQFVQRWAPSGPSGWAPVQGPRIEVLASELAVGDSEIVALLATGEYVVFDVGSGAQKAVLTADGSADLAAGRTGSMGIVDGVLWVLTHRNDRSELRRFDIASGRELGRAGQVGPDPWIAIGADAVWALDMSARRVVRIDSGGGYLNVDLEASFRPEAFALDPAGYPWLVGRTEPVGAEPGGTEITLGWIDPATRAAHFNTFDLAGYLPVPTDVWRTQWTLAVTDDAAWVGLVGMSNDPDPGDMYTVPVSSSIVRVAIDR